MSFYTPHCDNLKLISSAVKSVSRDLREYISNKDEQSVLIYTGILSHLINTWAEVSILKIIHERNAFNGTQISYIQNNNLEMKWKKALEFSILKTYKIKNISALNPSSEEYKRYNNLLSIIDNELLDSYQSRNRIAHGQWEYAFNGELTGINRDLTQKIRSENYIRLTHRYEMFKYLSQIIHDLSISKPTFERDFNYNYKKIMIRRNYYNNDDYESYKAKRIDLKEKGKVKKKALTIQEK
jgi:hypothetical protein